jgi:peptide/nickel transport system substrate-binding protein
MDRAEFTLGYYFVTPSGRLLAFLFTLIALTAPLRAEPVHGIAMHGVPALAADIASFPHVNPVAPRGGRLNLGAQGTFDSLNPFIIKGSPAQGLREYVYESLMARSPNEPFTLYGLLAGKVDVPADRSSITFFLRPEARFSDGKPVTADDVLFSHAILKEKGFPYHRGYYKKVTAATAIDAHTVRFVFDTAGDRELPLIMGLMPVLPRHRFTPETFERTTLEPPVGSGPYLVDAIDTGRSITYRRNRDHWARDLPVLKGRFNFDEVRFEYFRNSDALFEAFKTGGIDARAEDDPGRWAEGYRFAAVEDGRILKREFTIGLPAGMSALVFNTRRPVFADARVRQALIQAFDFSWVNRNLYHSLYTRTQSLFQRSYLASTGKPADAVERALLAPYNAAVTGDTMEGRFRLPGDGELRNNRDNLKRAAELLRAAGYTLDGDNLVNRATGQPLRFEFLARTRAQERLLLTFKTTLQQLGIGVSIRQVDDAQYWSRLKSFDFDMIQWTWGASLSPGNEQANRWGSGSADTQGSLNFAGVKNPAADAMIDAILKAATPEEFTSAVRALDRVILSGDYMIPLFHVQGQWIAHWRHLKAPSKTALSGNDFDTWWMEGEK